jgi:hypothetical protein
MSEFSPTAHQAQRLTKLFGDAERELLRECNCILLQSVIEGPGDPAQQRINQIKKELLDGCRQWVQEAIPECYLLGLKKVQGEFFYDTLGAQHMQALEVLAQNTFSRLAGVVDVVGRQIDDMIKQHNLAIIQQSLKNAPGRGG